VPVAVKVTGSPTIPVYGPPGPPIGGRFGWNVTSTSASATLPATSVAAIDKVFGPFVSPGAQLTRPSMPAATATPLHVAVAIPESASETFPLRLAADVRSVAPGCGDAIETSG